MNSKKLISLLSAAAMAATIVPTAALADGDTVLYSDSFNGYETSSKTDDGSVFAVAAGTAAHEAAGTFQWLFNSPQTRELDKLTVDATGSDDDTASIMINEKDAADKYLSIPKNRFPARCAPKITGFDNYTANAGEALVISFKAKLTAGVDTASAEVMPVLSLGSLGSLDSNYLDSSEWTEVKIVTADGSSTVYAGGTQVGSATTGVLSEVRAVPFDASTKCNAYAAVDIDDIVILSSASGADAVIPTAEDHSLDGDEPVETKAPAVAAPAFKAHANAKNLFSQTFNSVSTGSFLTMGASGQEYTDIDGLVFKVGGRENAADTFAMISENVESDNVARLVAGQYATAGRGIRMALADNLSIADTDLTSIMAFSFKLDAAAVGGKGQLYLFDNDTNVDGNGVARDILAVFTSDGNAENYKNGDTQIGINVTAGEWHTARLAVSNGSYRVYLDNDVENPAVKGEKVNTGATSKAVTNLPMIATTNSRSDDGSNKSLVTVDNVMAYQISESFEKKYLPEITDSQDDIMPGGETPSETSAPDATQKPSATAAPAKAAAPKLTAHASATNLTEIDFNSNAVGDGLTISADPQDAYTGIDGLNITIGARSGDGVTKAVVAENISGDNVLNTVGHKFAGNGRSAKIALNDNLSIAEDDSLTSIMGFAVRLAPYQDGGKGQLYLINNLSNVDGNQVPREVLAVLTTDGNSDSYKNGDTKIGIDVTANEWHTVVVAVSKGTYRVYLDGDYENPIVKGNKTGSGNTTYAVENLPILTATNGKDANYSKVDIDNIVAYQISASFEKKYLPTVSAAETYKVFTVNYDGDGRLASVTSEVVSDISAITPVLDGNAKKFVWKTNSPSGMEPIAIED